MCLILTMSCISCIGVWNCGPSVVITAWQRWATPLLSLLSSSPIFCWFQQHILRPLLLLWPIALSTRSLSTSGTFTQTPRWWHGQCLAMVPSSLHLHPMGAEYMEGEGKWTYVPRFVVSAIAIACWKQEGSGIRLYSSSKQYITVAST